MTTNQFLPAFRYINSITNAQQAVITFTTAHNFVVSEIVSPRVSTAYGMIEINNLRGKVLDFDTFTITIDIDTTNFTAFVYPGVQTFIPYNSLNLLLNFQQGMTLVPGSLQIIGAGGTLWVDPGKDGVLHDPFGGTAAVNYMTGLITQNAGGAPGFPFQSAIFGIETTQALPVCVPVGSGIVIGSPQLVYTILDDAFDNVRV